VTKTRSIINKEDHMKKSLVVIALACVMVFSFAATAMADHSPDFYFDFQPGSGVMNNTAFKAVFPDSWNTSVTAEIDNGAWFDPIAGGKTANMHGNYSQSSAKCEVCHAIHRAPTLGTGANGTPGGDAGVGAVSGTSSSRYGSTAWTAEASTQMLLKTTAARACIYCHVVEAPEKMYGGDSSLVAYGDWNEFYGHTTGCTGCHAVHGANTFQSATDPSVADTILKYQGVKNLGTIALKIQPEVYGSNGATDQPAGSLYTSLANAKAGVLSAAAIAAGVTPKAAAITAQCSICHASYAVGEETINANYLNAELFQPGTWVTANGSTAKIWVGTAANPVSVLPGTAGLTYTGGTPSAMTGAAGSLILAYKNHPMNSGTANFKGAGASAFFTSNGVKISSAGSSVCQSCHNAPENVTDGAYVIQSFPHYTPGYYKFMEAKDQTKFDTPSTNAQVMAGRQAFYSNGGKPAIMNDGYCTKCHGQVGIDY
jgi:cytochrome c553